MDITQQPLSQLTFSATASGLILISPVTGIFLTRSGGLKVIMCHFAGEDISVKTTLGVDEILFNQARKILGTPTIKGTVEPSLRNVIPQMALERLATEIKHF